MKKVKNLIKEYCDYIKKVRKLSLSTILRSDLVLKAWSQFLDKKFGLTLKKASPDNVLAWIDKRRADDVKDKTISRELCIIRMFYKYCCSFYALKQSPIAFLPEFICNPHPEQAVLTVDEAFDILETFDTKNPFGFRNYVLIALLWSTGLRSSELLALKWKDIDLKNGMLLVRKGKGSKQRQLVLNDRVLDDVKEYRNSILAGKDVPVFCSYPNSMRKGIYDSGLSYQQVTDIVREAVQNSGIKKKVNIMTFRHTFATHMYEADVPVRDIQEMMGHTEKSETTIYIHVTLDLVKDLFERHVYNTMGMDEVL